MGLTTARLPRNRSAPEAPSRDLPHVLLVVDQFPKTLGGGERIVLKLASLLPEYGYRVSILTFSLHPETVGLDSPPCPIYVLPLKRTYDLNAFRAVLELRRFLRQERVGVVQTFFESSDLWAGVVTKLFSRSRLIWSRRDMGILRASKHRLAYRLLSGMPDAVLAVSEQVRRYSIEVDGIDSSRVLTIYNGVDVEGAMATARGQRDPRTAVVTTVGNLRRVKGHDVLIRAAAIVKRRFPEVTFTIGGEVLDAAYFAELQASIADLELSRQVQFIGGVTRLAEHLRAADIFVLPSRSEGFSNAIIEAMAAGLPVVATAVGGNAEAVQDGVTGVIVPPEDPEALAAAILHMLDAPAEARQMGMRGRERAMSTFTSEAMMEQTTAVYERLLGARVTATRQGRARGMKEQDAEV